MRRRADSYVNATQILKVAGVDKGRRTKILEKEILPGKHEIVQGGYGKYQGTWSVKLSVSYRLRSRAPDVGPICVKDTSRERAGCRSSIRCRESPCAAI